MLDKLSEIGYKIDGFYALYESDTLFIYNCNNILYEQNITIPTNNDRTTIFDVNVTKENEYTLNIKVEYYE